jgi:hypothetical protein
MTTPPEHTVLNLTTYQDNQATFEDELANPTNRRTDGVTVHLIARTWHDMGRPSRLRIRYTISSAH